MKDEKGKPIVKAPSVGTSEVADATQQQNAVALQANCLYSCEVLAIDPLLRTITVCASDSQQIVKDCIPMASALSPLFGFASSCLPSIGTHGILMHTETENFFLGLTKDNSPTIRPFTGRAAGSVDEDHEVLPKNVKAYQAERTVANNPAVSGVPAPADVLPGEQEMSNGIGTALRLLQNFQQMSAGGLAKIETHLLNDMIRLVDNYYVHHTCGSDRMIWSNGHVNDEEHLTSYQFEADGKKSPDDEYAEHGATAYDPSQTALRHGGSLTSSTGRWRLSHYKGFLGDMIHTWVTCPAETVSGFMDGATRAGQFRSWVGADGTYMIQAAGGIHLRVARTLIIPEIKKVWNDPEVDQQKLYDSLDDTYLAIWGSGPKWDDLLTAVWQMRYYWRYLVDFHSLARFHQLPDDICHVPSEAECDTNNRRNSAAADEDDKKGAGAKGAHKGEATVDLYPDGSVQMQSMNTASITLNQGNVQIAAAGNLELRAGHTVSIQGKFVVLQSVLDMDIHSIYGRLTLKARTAWNALCEKGRMWLKSTVDWCNQDGNVAGNREGDFGSVTGDAQNPPELNKYGIFLDAPRSGILNYSKWEQVSHSKMSDVVMETERGKVALLTKNGQIQLVADGSEEYVVTDRGPGALPPDGGSPEPGDVPGHGHADGGASAANPVDHDKGSILIMGKQRIGVHAGTEVGFHYKTAFKLGEKFLLDETNTLYFDGDQIIDGRVTMSGNLRAYTVEAEHNVRSLGFFESKQAATVAYNKKMELPEVNAFPDDFTTDHERCDEVWKEAEKLEWEKDKMNIDPEFNLTFKLWQFRDWSPCSTGATFWRSYKRAPYEDAVDSGGYEGGVGFTRVYPQLVQLMAGPGEDRVNNTIPHWPGRHHPSVAEFNAHKFNVLSQYGPEFEAGDIAPGLSESSYYWYAIKNYPMRGPLHKWDSLPGGHSCDNKTK